MSALIREGCGTNPGGSRAGGQLQPIVKVSLRRYSIIKRYLILAAIAAVLAMPVFSQTDLHLSQLPADSLSVTPSILDVTAKINKHTEFILAAHVQ